MEFVGFHFVLLKKAIAITPQFIFSFKQQGREILFFQSAFVEPRPSISNFPTRRGLFIFVLKIKLRQFTTFTNIFLQTKGILTSDKGEILFSLLRKLMQLTCHIAFGFFQTTRKIFFYLF